MSLLLESKDSVGFNVSTAIWLKRITWIIVAFGALAVLHAGVLSKAAVIGSDISILWMLTIKTLAHLAYLYLVFWVLIFKEPPEKLFKQRFIFPIVLWIGYLSYFLSAYAEYANTYNQNLGEDFILFYFIHINRIFLQKALHIAPQIVFLILYVLWLIRDMEEYRETRSQQGEIFFWIIIEFISCVLISVRILYETAIIYIDKSNLLFFDKDFAIIICLSLWIIISVFRRLWEQSGYRDLYENYLKHNKFIGLNPTRLVGLDLVKIKDDGTIKILDFGCANGERLYELLLWLNAVDLVFEKRIKIYGVDIDEKWKAVYRDNKKLNSPEFFTSASEINIQEIDVIVLSHILYDENALNDVKSLLFKCNPGSIVIIRGASPNSFFTLTSMIYSLRLLNPTRSHYWYKCQLRRLEKECRLDRLYKSTDSILPDGVAIQHYELTEDSIDKAQGLLGYLYGRVAGDSAKRYLKELLEPGQASHVPNDDLIYVYKISDNTSVGK